MLLLMQFTIYDGSMENCPQLYLEKIDENIKNTRIRKFWI